MNKHPSDLFKYMLTIMFAACILQSLLAQTIAINEVMASNATTIADEDGDFEDWIEFYNYGTEPINLAGYGLSDSYSNPFKWVLPEIVIQPGEFLMVWASGKDRSDPGSPLHTNYNISAAGEEVLLTRPDSTLVDELIPTNIPTDISFGRFPDGTGSWFYFAEPTPNTANTTQTYTEVLAPPDFSHTGGFFSESFELSITHPDPDVTIVYTLDGSIPDIYNLEGTTYMYKNSYPQNPGQTFGDTLFNSYQSHLYVGTLDIYNRSPEPDKLSQISSTWHHTSFYFPTAEVLKGTVIRAIASKANALNSRMLTNFYFIGDNHFSLPVINITAQEDALFDYHSGIYVSGFDFDQWRVLNPNDPASGLTASNYLRIGDLWEKPANIKYFEVSNLTPAINQDIGIRIHGGWSRSYPHKSLRIYARNSYDNSQLVYPFFGQDNDSSFKRLILRNSGNDYNNTMFRDAAIQKIVKHLNFDTQDYQPVVVFINGEYWGIHNLRERYDKHFISRVYNIEGGDFDILFNNRIVSEGNAEHYNALRNYLSNNNISYSTHYAYVKTQMDIENYVDYFITNTFARNTDWPHNNIVFWRLRTESFIPNAPYGHDGRWRWMLFDTDHGFGLSSQYGDPVSFDMIKWITNPNGNDRLPNSPWVNLLMVNLLDNNSFKDYFIMRFADLLNSTFLPDRMIGIIMNMMQTIESEMPRHIHRWGRPVNMTAWHNNVNVMINFANQRPFYQRQHIREHFDIESDIDVTLDVNDTNAGYIRINTITITPETPGVPEEPYPWTGIYFHNIPIEVEAIANSGYAFSHWTGDAGSNEATLGITPTGNVSLTAHFIPMEVPELELIHFWVFDNAIPNDTSLESLDATFSIPDAGLLDFHSALEGYPFEFGHPNWRKASMERRNAPTEINYRPEGNNGLLFEDFTMRALQIKQPFTGDGGENTMIFHLPTQGYKDIIFSFAALDEGAAERMIIDYSVSDEEPLWTNGGLANDTLFLSSIYELYEVDFAGITEVNENPDFKIRIRFDGPEMTADNGDRVTFNNLSLDGVSTFVPLEFYSKATGDLNALASWGSEPDGSGSNPGSFTNDGTTFFLQNREEAILESNWTVSGIGSKVVVGDGSNTTNLILNATLNSLVDVSANATLTLAVEDYPEFGQLESNSTIVFKEDAQLIPYTIFHHLVLDDIDPEFDGNGTITVQGNLTLSGDVAMPDARGADQYNFMFTGSEDQTITTNTNVLRSYNMSFVKTQGEVNFAGGSIISTDNQLTFNFVDDALFSDNGIIMYAGNSVNIGGDSDAYDFTGTLILAGTEEGIVNGAGAGNNFNIRETGSINNNPVAALNNLVIRVPNTGGEFRLRDGSTNEFKIKGNFIIESGAAGRIRFYGNDVFIGGDFIIEEGFAGTLDPLLSLALKGIEQQEVLSSLNLNTAELIVDNPAGILLDAQVNISAELTFENGILHLTEDALVRLGLSATASGFAESQYINGRLVFTVNNLESLELFYPVGTQSNFVPFSFEVSHDNTDEVVYIGRVKAFEPLESGLDETLEFVLEDYQYELDFEGLPEIAQSRIIIPFDEPTLGFDPTLLRIAKLEAGSWMNLGGLIEGASIGSTESFTLPGIFALAKAATEPEFPESLTLQDITFDGASDTCFAATQTITLAGDGTTLTVQDGAIVKIIAGENIIAHPQTHFESGSQVHLYIDETGTWCVQPESLVASKNNEHWFDEKLIARVPFVFSVYPNPTSGQITIKINSDEPVGMVMIDIFNLMGEKLLRREFFGMNNHVVNISEFSKGIYVLRLISGTEHEIKKILKY